MPLRSPLGQEFSGYVTQMEHGIVRVKTLCPFIPTCFGEQQWNRLKYYKEFGVVAAAKIAQLTQIDFVSAENKFEALAAHDALC